MGTERTESTQADMAYRPLQHSSVDPRAAFSTGITLREPDGQTAKWSYRRASLSSRMYDDYADTKFSSGGVTISMLPLLPTRP